MNLTINIKEGDNIEKILKIYKYKINKLQVIKIFKNNLHYIKPSQKKRINKLNTKK
ncbi:30S ribosomal protein S21 [Candidatus Shikimatogenerans bostrichidophilus]|uniref:30S ribosomal protein S21 n=1 Tax=Candidatus Shikimatogenerans bostrichidophilus TaxID=2943807 RepID=UPI002966D487